MLSTTLFSIVEPESGWYIIGWLLQVPTAKYVVRWANKPFWENVYLQINHFVEMIIYTNKPFCENDYLQTINSHTYL